MRSALHSVALPDEELLEMACGLESLGRRFDELLARYAVEPARSTEASDERVVALVLGLVSLRSTLSATFAAAATAPLPDSEGTRRPEGSWLR